MEADHRVNAPEVAIDEECSTVIARRRPPAKDLRMVLTAAKTITDLARIGDHAKNISGHVVYLVKGKDVSHTGIEALEREASG